MEERLNEQEVQHNAETESHDPICEAWQRTAGRPCTCGAQFADYGRLLAVASQLAEALRDGVESEEHSRWVRRTVTPALAAYEAFMYDAMRQFDGPDADIAAGRVRHFDNAEDFLAALDAEDPSDNDGKE